jgi:Domain of unknown function (DUF4190)
MTSGSTNYSMLSTQQLEDMLRVSILWEEEVAIREELDRRYTERIHQEAGSTAERNRHTPQGPYEERNQERPQHYYQPPPPPMTPPSFPKGQQHGHQASPFSNNLVKSRYNTGINHLAIASFVLGIFWFFWLGSIAGLITGFIALEQIKRYNQSGRRLAIIGIVASALWLLGLLANI